MVPLRETRSFSLSLFRCPFRALQEFSLINGFLKNQLRLLKRPLSPCCALFKMPCPLSLSFQLLKLNIPHDLSHASYTEHNITAELNPPPEFVRPATLALLIRQARLILSLSSSLPSYVAAAVAAGEDTVTRLYTRLGPGCITNGRPPFLPASPYLYKMTAIFSGRTDDDDALLSESIWTRMRQCSRRKASVCVSRGARTMKNQCARCL